MNNIISWEEFRQIPGAELADDRCSIMHTPLDEIPENERVVTRCCLSTRGDPIYHLYKKNVLRQALLETNSHCCFCGRRLLTSPALRLFDISFGERLMTLFRVTLGRRETRQIVGILGSAAVITLVGGFTARTLIKFGIIQDLPFSTIPYIPF